MDVQHNEGENRFEIQRDGEVSVLEYKIHGDTIDIFRTFVPEKLRGGSIAHDLVVAGLDYARAEGLKVIPSCWFVEKFISKKSKYQDLLK